MKRLYVTMPDSLYKSFLDFFKHVPNITIKEKEEDLVIPEWHKKIVLDRIKSEKGEDGITWQMLVKN